jgi:DedD protein
MPTANPPELSAAELELKRRGRRRLIGAVTMGLLAIVILPMIFDSEPRKKQAARQEIEVQIPPKEGLPPLPTPVAPSVSTVEAAPQEINKAGEKSGQLPAVAPAEIVTAKVSTTEPDKSSKTKPVEVSPPPAKSVPAKADAKPPATAPLATSTSPVSSATASSAPAAVSGFVIQLGAYKDAENAKALVARMKEAKLPVFTDVLPVKTGTVTRVRVGPFPTREKADGALAQVKLAGVDGKIVSSP